MSPSTQRTAWFTTVLCVLAVGYGALKVAVPHPIDDAGFFFRYAANAAAGEGFCFNPGEPPTLGVSSPLWCAILALFAWLGAPPESAHLPLGVAFTMLAAGLLCFASSRRFGPAAGVAVAFVWIANGRILVWASPGMETSLGFVWVALGLSSLLAGRSGALRLGLLAGLCAVHKLDLMGFALGLVLCAGAGDAATSLRLRVRPMARACGSAALVVAAYASWAWLRFGSPLPLSFLRKFGRDFGAVDSGWFVREALWRDSGPWLCLLAASGVWRLWRQAKAVIVSALLLIGSQTLAYTLRPPAEPYSWYAVSLQPALSFLAGVGLFALGELLARPLVRRPRGAAVAVAVVVGLGSAFLWRENRSYRRGQLAWSLQVEAPRIEAGQWIASNTPPDARLATPFGLPAYYSHRHILDGSGLTKELPPGDFLGATQPDFVATCEFESDVTPETYQPPNGYTVRRFFGPNTLPTYSVRFFMVALERNR